MTLDDLLLECRRRGATLRPERGRLRVQGKLPRKLLDAVRRNASLLLAKLTAPPVAVACPKCLRRLPSVHARCPSCKRPAACDCGGAMYRETAIHGGQSVRRDCARCGRFLAFTRWKGCDLGPSPPVWPPGVPMPVWWPIVARTMRDVIVAVAAHICSDCAAPVAVQCRDQDGTLQWSCPRCRLSAGSGELPDCG